MRLSPVLGSMLLVNAWGTAADTVPCPNPALLSGDLVTITSGQTAWSVSSAVAGAALLGGQVTAPVNTTAKWLIEAQGLASHPTGYVFAAFNNLDLQVVTSDVSPQAALHLEPIEQGVNSQSWNISCGVCFAATGLPDGAHLAGACVISPVLAPGQCVTIENDGVTIALEDCADNAGQTFDFWGTVSIE
ncbi:hypothetical protein MVEN_01835200 [Mycena venus]|uniref:Uncharacterized protein n=1 Tax=Mycena venus TaxID=2733690 RepID=A0A8H7CLU0_9AGAR|nr:hypothetical protein MVEN_01835200 [Mycena venus]